MAGTLGDLVWTLAGNPDSSAALAQAVMGGTPGGGAATPAGPGTGGGATMPGASPQPEAYQSPPDLMAMYANLSRQQAFSNSFNNGVGLILSGFAHPDNKENIMDVFGGGGGGGNGASLAGGSGMDMLTEIMKFQQGQADLRRKAQIRATLPQIAKKYNLDDATAAYLFETGKLDAVIAEAEKPNVEVTDFGDGRKVLVDKDTGKIGEPFGIAKKREIEIRTDGNTQEQFAVYKDTGERVGSESIVKGVRKQEYMDMPDGSKVLVYSDTKEPVPEKQPIPGPPRKQEYMDMPDGSRTLVFSDTKEPVQNGRTLPAAPKKIVFQDDGKGGKIAMYEDGTRVPDKDIPGLGATEKEQLYNAAKLNSGDLNFPSMEDWLSKHEESSSTKINVGPTGIDYGKPPENMAWKRDKAGNVLVDEDGAPMAVPIKGTKAWSDAQAAGEKDNLADVNKAVSSTFVEQEIDRALDNIESNKDDLIGSTGWSSMLFSGMPRSDAKQLAGLVDTIRANVTMDKLQQMRAASQNGASGLGAVSDFENKLMADTAGKLDLTGQDKDIKYNLRRIKALYTAIIRDGVKNQAEADRILSAVPYDDEDAAPEEESIEDILKRNQQ